MLVLEQLVSQLAKVATQKLMHTWLLNLVVFSTSHLNQQLASSGQWTPQYFKLPTPSVNK